MATGLPPKFTQIAQQENTPTHQLLMLALYTAQELEWDVQYLSRNGIIAFTRNGFLKFNAELRLVIRGQEMNVCSTSTGNEYFDFGKNKKTVALFLEKFSALKKSYSAELLDTRYESIEPNLIPDTQDILLRPETESSSIFSDIAALFKPSGSYFITPLILDLNLLIFVLMSLAGADVMSPDGLTLLRWGANYRPAVLAGDWWRLLSCCFIHIGILHLLLNMYALVYIGVLIEPILGKGKTLVAYCITGIAGSVGSIWWHQQTISAGASGAIFGLYGVFLAMLTGKVVDKATRRPLLISMIIFIIYNLMNGLKEQVDNAAHTGGLICGFVLGIIFLPMLKKNSSYDIEEDRDAARIDQ